LAATAAAAAQLLTSHAIQGILPSLQQFSTRLQVSWHSHTAQVFGSSFGETDQENKIHFCIQKEPPQLALSACRQ